MTYAGERTIFDADSHLLELPDFLSSHADTRTRRLLPDLGATLVGQFNPGQYDQKQGHDPERVRQLVELGDNLTRGPKWHEALGSFNGPERTQALDLLGFSEQVVFSSFCARLIFDPDNDRRKRGPAVFVRYRIDGLGCAAIGLGRSLSSRVIW